MKVYNTLTKKKEQLVPIDDKTVRMYSCGPTVYSYAHIGNMKAFLFMDFLKRSLNYLGYKVKNVMNITDVGHLVSDADEGEDKMIKTAKSTNKTPWEIAAMYTDAFLADIKKLNIQRPNVLCKASEHIEEMLEMVYKLYDEGYAYETSDGIYFDIAKFPQYGRLSNLDLEGQLAGARVAVNEEKRHPADFALWKKAPKEHIMQWDSRWGMGYPGWHIECSAMSRKYLGDQFDIHTGGVDHIPIHHENEIAQSDAFLKKQAVKYWMHCEFLQVDGGKMSKSMGTAYLLSDLEEKGYEPLAFRYMCLNAHYGKKLNFTWDGIEAAQKSLNRLSNLVLEHKESDTHIDSNVIEEYKQQFREALQDDLNLPLAMSTVWNAARNNVKSKSIYNLLMDFDKVLALDLDKKRTEAADDIPEEVTLLAEQRLEARKNKDWKKSDQLRDRIRQLGYSINDTPAGQVIKKG
ncbi:MAG TPA: cysteine--tRNA ligase [Clostridia bacterium]|jgi:cysteinyl-tRNA synthetase|nr:cysteine--tRNA ligase [Clostridiaceae bacterium]HOF26357.1 cysteine--tRNA ligase [Clostridia bacterium]HOM34237.1 cysteine--tRNA ligase [Clostridia bacterium]HOR89716.1 cysteine--tRNA ligase [Clostridia bacterium]HOT70853.1 cysteine--tRNA ligase [Clostridia bacterium]